AYKLLPSAITTTTVTKVNINWDVFYLFLTQLAQGEPEVINQLGSIKTVYPSKMIEVAREEGGINFNKFREAWYQNALGARDPTAAITLGYKPPGITINDVNSMCKQFIVGIS